MPDCDQIKINKKTNATESKIQILLFIFLIEWGQHSLFAPCVKRDIFFVSCLIDSAIPPKSPLKDMRTR